MPKTDNEIFEEIQQMTDNEKIAYLLIIFNLFDSNQIASILNAYAEKEHLERVIKILS